MGTKVYGWAKEPEYLHGIPRLLHFAVLVLWGWPQLSKAELWQASGVRERAK